MSTRRPTGLVLLLGDQPGVTRRRRGGPAARRRDSPLAVIRYDDGLGHPFWFRRDVFADLAALHGDKAVWKLLESGRHPVREVAGARGRCRSTSTPRRTTSALLALEARAGEHPVRRPGRRRPPARRRRPPRRRGHRHRALPRRHARSAAAARRRAGRREDGRGQGHGDGAGRAAHPVAVLRGPRRQRGALRVELPAPAARHPPGRGAGAVAGGRRPVHRGVPARTADPAPASGTRGRWPRCCSSTRSTGPTPSSRRSSSSSSARAPSPSPSWARSPPCTRRSSC